jgi:hypothetical protein
MKTRKTTRHFLVSIVLGILVNCLLVPQVGAAVAEVGQLRLTETKLRLLHGWPGTVGGQCGILK